MSIYRPSIPNETQNTNTNSARCNDVTPPPLFHFAPLTAAGLRALLLFDSLILLLAERASPSVISIIHETKTPCVSSIGYH